MKKTILFLFAMVFCLSLSACSGETPESPESSTIAYDVTLEEPTENTSHFIEDFENYTSEYQEPTFPIYYQFSDCESSIALPSSDKTETQDGKEIAQKNGKTVYEKTYDANGRIADLVIYEEDGETVSQKYAFAYVNGMTFSSEYYENGEMTERFQYNYGSDGKITSVYRKGMQSETGYGDIECYEFNPDGSVKNYINSANLSDMMMDLLSAALSGQLSQ